MTKPLKKLLEIVVGELPEPGSVLDVGSRQEKNQAQITNLRPLFGPKTKFVGVDMRKGSGVDMIVNAEKLPFGDREFGLVCCLETLEHAQHPWLIASELERVLAKQGTLVISSQQNFPIHLHPSDYFRFTPYGLVSLFSSLKSRLLLGMSPAWGEEAKLNPETVVLVGWKTKQETKIRKLRREIRSRMEEISGHKPYRHRLQDGVKWIKRGIWEAGFCHGVEFF